MKRVTKQELKTLEAKGAKVRRKMGTAPKSERPAPAPKPKKVEAPKQHASMGASMADTAARELAMGVLVAKNTEVIGEFAKAVADMPKPAEPSPYTFDLKRDKEGLLERVFARPGILEG